MAKVAVRRQERGRGSKAPISAVINGDGEVVEIKEAKITDDEVSVEKDHRWVLAMETILMNNYGITKGSKLIKSSLPNIG